MPSKKRKRAGKAKAIKPGQKKKTARPEAKKKKTLLQKPRFRKAPSRLNSIILIILDGWGIRGSKKKNAIKLARTPNMDFLAANYPSTKIQASGSFVGLPKRQMGNSEVGHMNIGAGRIVGQEFVIISKAIKNGSFYKNKNIIEAFKNGNNIHIMGLLSDGGIHSHISHLFALLKMAKKYKKFVHVHAFLDGRDTPKKSAGKYIKQLEKKLKGIGEIATISGRYYAMDRDKRWERTEKAYNCIALGKGTYSRGPLDGLNEAYRRGETDEFVQPTLTSLSYKGVRDGDSVIFFNFREDRARQLSDAFVIDEFMSFRREKKKVHFLEMVRYEKGVKHVHIAFMQPQPENTLGEVVSKSRMKQLRIAETEKYAHVTFFLNGSREKVFPGEDRVLIPSPKVATYDLKPEMSAFEIKDEVIKRIKSGKYDLIVLNFANPDMVGHTGILEASIKGCEAVDSCIGEIVKEIIDIDGAAIVIADHGNCEEMIGKWETTHTTNPVPFILVSNYKYSIKKKGALCNIAPTILKLLGIKKPKEMAGGMI
ncbi:MAG TPA: 2,3-bisphosphoglycerate-independent phosphoglycerate mutase [Candidatus Nanoarchaeia archaeon]|nr:2,3-bisphosphoglycerate-independent phosphoglycerate mutase [Candidatus Nanoarchaeia archaeon]